MAELTRDSKGEVTRVTYRVDVLTTIGTYTPYTSKRGVGLPMATSLADGLKRQKNGGRIVELPSGKLIDEWATTSST
jgi:hypothetical protein